MKIADIESSFFKVLYDNFEVPLGIKVFESILYVDFAAYDRWIVIDSLSNSTGPLPRANFLLHLSIKNGLLNDKVVLNRLCDTVTQLLNPGVGLAVYDDATGVPVGGMLITETSLLPVMEHVGGGCFRSLSLGLVYAGEVQ